MKKTVLVASAVLALSVMTAPVALAQDGTASCDQAKTKVSDLEKKLDNARADERAKEKVELDKAKEELRAAQVKVDQRKAEIDALPKDAPSLPELRTKLEADRAKRDVAKAVRDAAQERFDNDSQRVAGLRAQVELALQERDNACSPVTTTPTATPTPELENDVDCDEVSDDEAQRILNADRSDPNNLDADGDGTACEVDEILPESDNDDTTPDVTVNNNVAVPSGGISTGVGPRDS